VELTTDVNRTSLPLFEDCLAHSTMGCQNSVCQLIWGLGGVENMKLCKETALHLPEIGKGTPPEV